MDRDGAAMKQQQTATGNYARQISLDDGLIAPYGGKLVQAFVPAQDRAALTQRIPALPRIAISGDDLLAMEMIASGAFSPLTGFMTRGEYDSVLQSATLPGGLPWSLPVTLAVSRQSALSVRSGDEAALYRGTEVVGVMRISEIFPWDPAAESRALLGTEDLEHPAIAGRVARHASHLIGGEITLLASRGADYLEHKHLWPLELRGQFVQRGWQHVAVAHVQHVWRRTHEYLLKCALEGADGLVLHNSIDRNPAQGFLPHEALAGVSHMLIEGYFPVERVIENPVPAMVLQGGARAALMHAILSQNYGCSEIYLQAGQNAGGSGETPALFTAASMAGLEIRPVFMQPAFHCDQCGGIATVKSCPHSAEQRVDMSDDEVFEQLRQGESVSALIARPDVVRALARAAAEVHGEGGAAGQGRHIYPHASEVSPELRQSLSGHKSAVLWMTGLSGSGKSTIAHRLERELLLSGHRVFVLDGDTLRNGLNRDLGFSEQDRRENLRRAGETARVLVEAGLIVIASFISPFRAERQMVREILGEAYREIYVYASLEDCEQRDPKGLYRRARSGQIPQFTGISSPYEEPENPDLRLDTTNFSAEDCVREVRNYLGKAGLLRMARQEMMLAGWQTAAMRNRTRIQ